MRADVEAQRRPAVLARRDEPVVQLLRRRAHVGLGARAARELHQRVRLLGAGAEDAARPVVLEAARRPGARRWRAAPRRACRPRSPVAHAVELEARAAARDRRCPPARQAEAAASSIASSSPMRALARMSCVRVSRRTEPAAAAGAVLPQLVVRAARVVAQVDVREPRVVGRIGRRAAAASRRRRR